MFFSEQDVQSWKEDIKSQAAMRKTGAFNATQVQFNKPVTWRDVKQKEMEYHPILQKFSTVEKENSQKTKEDSSWQKKADHAKKHVEKYMIDYNIINLEKDNTIAARPEKDINAGRLMAPAQVDYNILTNTRLDEMFLKNLHPNANKRSADPPQPKANPRDFNIISNKYYLDHDNKTDNDMAKTLGELNNKFNKTHDYNPVLAEFYDAGKESAYVEKRSADAKEHGKHQIEKLPPTIKNREMIIFDPTREVPEAIKVLDQKKKEAMKKYELRYQVEGQLRDRDIAFQAKEHEMKMNRINDKKYVEQYEKGFDIITMNDYGKNEMKFVPKPTHTKWEKLKLTSNPVQALPTQSRPAVSAKPTLSTKDLQEARGNDITPGITKSAASGWNGTVKSASIAGYENIRGLDNSPAVRSDAFQVREFKSAAERAREPTFNYADNYNQYCVPPKKVQDDFNTRTLPQIKVSDNNMKFLVTKTGGFKKGETTAA